MCSWTVIELVNLFKQSGSTVVACLLDYRKAFDLVNHEKLFRILIKRKVGLIFVRLLMFIYIHQRCYVNWNNTRSYSFGVTNGTRQGSVFSPRGGFGVYLDPLLQLLRESGHGLRYGLHWYGGLAYCDDLILLATSVASLQEMVNICSSHAADNDLLFSSDKDPLKSKTVCLNFSCKKNENIGSICLNNDPLPLPWKVFSKHIGCSLHQDGIMDHDMKIKRATFISDSMNLNNEFSFLRPEEQIRLMYLYNSHFPGSSTSLLVSVKSSCLSLTDSNLRRVLLDTGIKIEPGSCLNNYRVYKTPLDQEWRIGLLKSLIEIRDNQWSVDFDEEIGVLVSQEVTISTISFYDMIFKSYSVSTI